MKLFLILTFLISLQAKAQNYILGQVGYMKLAQGKAMENNVTPAGISYAAGIGRRKDFFEVEALLLKGSGEDDVLHDGQKNKLVHEQTSLILALNFYFTKAFYLRAGFGVHKIDQNLKDDVSAASKEGAEEAYGIVEDDLSEGIVVGGGYVLYKGKQVELFTQLEKYSYSSIDSGAWNGTLGFRFYLQ